MFNYILQKRGIESKAKIQTDGFRSGRTRTFGKNVVLLCRTKHNL